MQRNYKMTESWWEYGEEGKGWLGWPTATVFLKIKDNLLACRIGDNKCTISSACWYKTVRRFKRKHLTAVDCQHLARSHLAVTQPFGQRWTNRDPNHGLYPRPRTKRGTRGMSFPQISCVSESVVCVAFEYLPVFVNTATVILWFCCSSLTLFHYLWVFYENSILSQWLVKAPEKHGWMNYTSWLNFNVVGNTSQHHHDTILEPSWFPDSSAVLFVQSITRSTVSLFFSQTSPHSVLLR